MGQAWYISAVYGIEVMHERYGEDLLDRPQSGGAIAQTISLRRNEVSIRREGRRVILEAAESDQEWVERIAGSMDESMAKAIEDGHLGPEAMPDGPHFD